MPWWKSKKDRRKGKAASKQQQDVSTSAEQDSDSAESAPTRAPASQPGKKRKRPSSNCATAPTSSELKCTGKVLEYHDRDDAREADPEEEEPTTDLEGVLHEGTTLLLLHR
jgi:hypothetical protein